MNRWDEVFSEPGFAYGTEPNDFLDSVIGRLPAGKVLCLAEGEGRNAVYLAENGFNVTAVDGSKVGLVKATQLAHETGVKIKTVIADLNHFQIEPESWDVIVSIWVHFPHDLRKRIHQSVVSGLASGGAFVLEAYTPKQLELGTGGPGSAERMMTRADLEEELSGLDFDILHEIERDVHEGRNHNGRGAVVQCLAFKP